MLKSGWQFWIHVAHLKVEVICTMWSYMHNVDLCINPNLSTLHHQYLSWRKTSSWGTNILLRLWQWSQKLQLCFSLYATARSQLRSTIQGTESVHKVIPKHQNYVWVFSSLQISPRRAWAASFREEDINIPIQYYSCYWDPGVHPEIGKAITKLFWTLCCLSWDVSHGT
jgi:hypothetical protein